MQGFRLWVTYSVSAGRADEGDGDGRIVSLAEVGCGTAAESVLQPQSGEVEFKKSLSLFLEIMFWTWINVEKWHFSHDYSQD